MTLIIYLINNFKAFNSRKISIFISEGLLLHPITCVIAGPNKNKVQEVQIKITTFITKDHIKKKHGDYKKIYRGIKFVDNLYCFYNFIL
jgi:hypothetical protein